MEYGAQAVSLTVIVHTIASMAIGTSHGKDTTNPYLSLALLSHCTNTSRHRLIRQEGRGLLITILLLQGGGARAPSNPVPEQDLILIIPVSSRLRSSQCRDGDPRAAGADGGAGAHVRRQE